jgi:ribosomal protein S18 acetylase RimI-like enzyme
MGYAVNTKSPQPFRKAAMKIRDADVGDVEQMSAFLKELTAAGKRKSPDDKGFVRTHYIDDPNKVCCSVAEEDGVVLCFQSLTRAMQGNPYGVEPGWGIIGTHIRPSAARRGLGRALFEVSRRSARAASILHIDATIAAENSEALAYYDAMGLSDISNARRSDLQAFRRRIRVTAASLLRNQSGQADWNNEPQVCPATRSSPAPFMLRLT